jgi:hypothetical protein
VRGRRDGRTVVLVPEPVDGVVGALTLVHVELSPSAPAHRVRRAVEAAGRVGEIVAAVTEVSPGFPLAAVWEAPPAVLLLDPVESVLRVLRPT